MAAKDRALTVIGAPLLRWAPRLTLAVFLLPIVAGFVGTLLPAFGWLPAIGERSIGWSAWQTLFALPGFGTSVWLTVSVGWLATVGSAICAVALVAWSYQRPIGRWVGRAVAPILAMPHSALAIGFAFLIAPSGWVTRAISPWLTGWDLPPDFATVGHPSGWPLVACLMLKEVPYLVLMIIGALNQVPAPAQLLAARSMGYSPVAAWIKVVLPQVYPQLRLPILAVLAFSLSVVDVALVLGPGNPPTLAVQAVRWFADPDLRRALPGAAAALLVALIVAASVLVWWLLERAVKRVGRIWIEAGNRSGWSAAVVTALGRTVPTLSVAALASMLAMALWSFARPWRFPNAWPPGLTLETWRRQSEALLQPALSTLAVGVAATAVALVLVVAWLENEASQSRAGAADGSLRTTASARRVTPSSRWRDPLTVLYLPLLVPQVAFLFGLQILLVRAGIDATWTAVIWAHLVFVLPYLFLSLADPWRAFDKRYTRTALSLGRTPAAVFWRIKLPILLRPVLIACSVAFAVSVGLYLPTLFAGGGRIATLTTEAVTLSAGADRRVIGAWALMQMLLPWGAFGLALLLPRWLFAGRRGLA